jgi:flagellar biosynthesis component FlhA
VHNIKSRESILKDLDVYQKSRKDPNGIDVQAYVAEALGRVVGVAIIRQEADIEYLRSSFNIEDFILYTQHKREEHGHINHFALIPIFSYLTKYFIREILRKSNKTCLYYPIYPEYCTDDVILGFCCCWNSVPPKLYSLS